MEVLGERGLERAWKLLPIFLSPCPKPLFHRAGPEGGRPLECLFILLLDKPELNFKRGLDTLGSSFTHCGSRMGPGSER